MGESCGAGPTINSRVTALITPSVPTAPGNLHLALSNLDLADMRIFTPVVLMYEGKDSSDFQTVVANLKDALRKVLVEYYPFAGRIAKGENGVAEVRCDDSGAYFTQVVVEEELAALEGRNAGVELVDFGAANLKTQGFNPYSLNDCEEIPPLVIQITSFKCMTIALAVCWHHVVADGAAGTSFLKAWSEVARGLHISSPPDHRRHLLSARVPPQPHEGCPPEFKLISPQPATSQSTEEANGTKRSQKVEFIISQSEIQQLKKQAAEENPSVPFTSGELISAHLWKLVTTARNLNREGSTVFFSILDGRKRMKDIPANLFGNCIFERKAIASVGDVVDMPLGQVAKLIHDSISGLSDDYFRSVLDWIEVTGPQHVVHEGLSHGDLLATFWRYFSIYELDFGFGRPIHGGRSNLGLMPGFSVVNPTPSCDGSVAITVGLYPEAADALEATLKLQCLLK